MNTPEEIIAQFPTRPLNFSKAMTRISSIKIMIGGIIICLLSLLIPYFSAPELIYDYEISKNPVEVNADIGGNCGSRLLIFTNCNFTLKYKGKEFKRRIAFIDLHLGDYSVRAIASRDNPDLLTIDMAIDKIPNRIIFIALFFVPILFLGMFCFRKSWQINRMNKLLKIINGNRLYPVLVPVKIKLLADTNIVAYTWSINKVPKKYSAIFNGTTEGGILIVPTTDSTKVYALGVSIDEQTAPIVLDKALTRIDLTDDERAKLLDAIYKKA